MARVGALTGALALGIACAAAPAPSERQPAADPSADRYLQYRNIQRQVEFRYPEGWELEEGECEQSGPCALLLRYPVSETEPGERKSLHDGEIQLRLLDGPLDTCVEGRETMPVPGMGDRAVYILTGGEAVYDEQGFYIAWGDSLTVCMTYGPDRSAWIHAFPGPIDHRELGNVLESFKFLGGSSGSAN